VLATVIAGGRSCMEPLVGVGTPFSFYLGVINEIWSRPKANRPLLIGVVMASLYIDALATSGNGVVFRQNNCS
jgi:hypothetical protein